MKSPAQEAFAQVMFWTGMGCFPLTIILIVLGALTKKTLRAVAYFLLATLTFTHFLWFFSMLGGALGTKVGRYEPPDWFSFFPPSLACFVVVMACKLALDHRRKQALQPPPLPPQ